ncbi:hypothetical protein EEJ42_00105 [Streptomyces botrytidirepellens]|uniref:Uncharacterized protein n=1 Tax=Streptomyces botrytidirepellens TaxID=2486417 RepID=A0A3M8XEC8_9ACTN|nr:hypothetical protein EEJ42_00105 [Streptomyces botrytidirepellens]
MVDGADVDHRDVRPSALQRGPADRGVLHRRLLVPARHVQPRRHPRRPVVAHAVGRPQRRGEPRSTWAPAPRRAARAAPSPRSRTPRSPAPARPAGTTGPRPPGASGPAPARPRRPARSR